MANNSVSTAIHHGRGVPSIFEVLAQESLNEAVKPACKHLFKVVAEHRPDRFGWCLTWFDEAYALLTYCLQHHFLRNYSATFAEHYYDLQRTVVNRSNNVRSGLLSAPFAPLAALVLLPYLHSKMDKWFLVAKKEVEVKGTVTISYSIVYHVFPYLKLVWNMMNLYHNFMFATGSSMYHSPIYRLLAINLITADSCTQHRQVGTGFQVLSRLLTGLVHASVFMLHFIEWWFDDEKENPLKGVMRSPLPSPPIDSSIEMRFEMPAMKGICPLCCRFECGCVLIL